MSDHLNKPLLGSKRQRVPVSCVVCRKRKIKCDRKKPFCSSCVKGGTEALCSYSKPAWIHSRGSGPQTSENPVLSREFPHHGADSVNAARELKMQETFGSNNPSTVSQPTSNGARYPTPGSIALLLSGGTEQTLEWDRSGFKSGFSRYGNGEEAVANRNGNNSRNEVVSYVVNKNENDVAINGVNNNASNIANTGASNVANNNASNVANTDASNNGTNIIMSDTNGSPRSNTNDLLVRKEIELLKDKINRLQTSLYITELSKPSSGSGSTRRSSGAATLPVRGEMDENHNYRLVNQGHFSENSEATNCTFSDPRSPSATSKMAAHGSGYENNEASYSGNRIGTPAAAPTPSLPREDMFDLDNISVSSPGVVNLASSRPVFKYSGMGATPSITINSSGQLYTADINQENTKHPEKTKPIQQWPAEFSLPDTFFIDNLMRSFQKGDMFNFGINTDSPFLYTVPISLSNKFTAEEGESVLDLTKNNRRAKTPSFENLSQVWDSSQSVLFSVSFNLIWYAFENDFYIKSSLALGCSEIIPFLHYFGRTILETGEIEKRFITNEEELANIRKHRTSLNLTVDTGTLRMIRNCIKVNLDVDKSYIEPLVIRPPSYLQMDTLTGQLLGPQDNRYGTLEQMYLRVLFSEIRKYFPERKITLVLCARFFKTMYHFFPFLEKSQLLLTLSDLNVLLFDNVTEYAEHLLAGSVTFTLDAIGILYVVLRISYLTVVDRMREKLYEADFNEQVLESAERYLLSCRDIRPDKFVHLAKCCFSYNMSFNNIYSDFHKVEFGLRKVQLGLFLLTYSLFFEDQMRHDGLLFKKYGNTADRNTDRNTDGNADGNADEQLPNSSRPEDQICSRHLKEYGQLADRAVLKDMTDGSMERDFYTDDLAAAFTSNQQMKDHKQGTGYSGSVAPGNFSFTTNNSLLVVQNVMADINNTFAVLVRFAKALKLDQDPMDFIDLNLKSSSLASNEELNETLATIKAWRLCWMEMINFDKTRCMAMGQKPIIDDLTYTPILKEFVNADASYGVESSEAKVRINTLVKRNKAHSLLYSPILQLNERLAQRTCQVKLKDYLSIVKSIDNFVEFNNDFKLNEIFDFIDGFQRRYPVYFESPALLDAAQMQEYYSIEARSINKTFEVVHALYWNVMSLSTQFTLYYSLFCHLDRVICFERSHNDVPIFKKVFMNTESIVCDLIKFVRKIFNRKHYRKFVCSHFKSLFKRAVEPMLLSLFIHQHGIIIRLIHTIKLLQDYSNQNQRHPNYSETTKKVDLFFQLLRNTIASAGELLDLMKAMNNFDKEPYLPILSKEQVQVYENINFHSFQTCSLYSTEAISIMSLEHAFITNMKFKSIDDLLDSEEYQADLFEINSVKLKKFGTVKGQNIILPNFNSFLYFDNNEILYVSNELMKDFNKSASVDLGLTPKSMDPDSSSNRS